MEKVIETAGRENKIIEINANPFRLDLDWRWGKLARSKGVKTAINPDAHSIEGLKDYQYGIGIARKGGFTKEEILNSYKTNEVKAFFESLWFV
jgi:DNA polymerase (family 10)